MKICHTCQQTYSDTIHFCPRDGDQLTAQATETETQLAGGLSRRFRIVRQLGAGGMGAVFLAEQIAVGNRPVALRVLSRKLLDDPDFLLRFQNEAASTGRIHHPNVVTIYESGQAGDGTPYIAMEFLEGESLRQALTRRGALPVPEVAEILQQAARGLNAAHKLGIIHRDLKPDNIFLTYPDDVGAPLVGAHDVGAGLVPALPVGIADTGRAQDPPLRPVVVKLVDFGIAKLRESGAHTQTGMVLGTPAYMSFEQASGMRSDELDARSDIYSLGVVTYEMLTGRTPFHSDTPVGYLRMHMQEDPPPFPTVKPDLPALPQLENVVMKALTKDRDQRYASALDFAHEFMAAAADSPPAAQAELQREVAKPQPQTKVTPVPKTSVPAAGGDTVAAKTITEIAHPSRRKWLVNGVRWKRVGIIASVVWILGAGIYTLKVQDDADSKFVNDMTLSCIDAYNFQKPALEKCLKKGTDSVAERIPGERLEAAIVALVPVPLGWGFIYLVLFLVRWIRRPLAAARTPQFQAAPEPPSKMKFFVIAGAALILIVVGVLYFWQQAERNPNPDGSINKADMSSSAKAEPSHGEAINPKDGLKYVWIPPGTFQMGCSPGDSQCGREEKPPHQVTITKGFWLGQTEVTVRVYKRFAAATGRQMPPEPVVIAGRPLNPGWGDEAMPIVDVTWDDARAYCSWTGGRLPTEAEWEYAARAGSTEVRYGPIDEVAWYADNSGRQRLDSERIWKEDKAHYYKHLNENGNNMHDVGQKRANGFGLYDVLGNVYEWVNDWYDKKYYQISPSQDPAGPTSGAEHVVRGDYWGADPRGVRISNRAGANPGARYYMFGVRCVGEASGP